MHLRSSDEMDLVSILEQNLIDSSPKKEILGKKSGSLDLNMLDSGLNEEITSSDLVMDGNVEVESVVEEDDGHVKVINVFGNNLMDEDSSDADGKTKMMKDEEACESDGSVKVIMDKGFTMINNITPRKKNLVVKVQDVSSWWQPGYGNNHPTFEVVLMDEQGFVMMRLRSSDEKDSVSILEENLIDSSSKKEILEKKSGSLDLNMLDSGLNVEITSSALVMDGNVEVESVVEEDDGDVQVINVLGNNLMDEDSSDVDGETKKMKDEEDGESVGRVVVKKGKRGRKRKVVGSSEKVKAENDGVRVSGMVLRSSVKMTSGSLKADESRLNESVVGFKRQMEAECFDQSELDKEVDEKSQVMVRRNKKPKLRGRPLKMQGEIGFSRKILDENDVEEVGESALLIGKEQKKQKHRGRPPKLQGEIGSSRKILDENDIEEVDESALLIGKEQKKQKRRGRPPKTQGEIGSSRKILDENDVEEVDERALLIAKEQKKQKRLGRPPQMHGETVENNDHTTAEDTVKSTNTLKLKNCIGGRRVEQQLVRDQIVSMIMKAGWTIEYRLRQNKQRLDTVYVDRQGKTHWSVRNAYLSLKMKIENGVACINEVSAFTSIPNKKLSVLLRPVSKVRSDKNMKRKKKGNNACNRRMKQQLVRDQIDSMILKAGWTIEYRPRQNKQYLAAVYVDQQGKTHWSVTKAYFSLKMKIEKGVACKKEVSAFTSIPNKKLSMLLKSVSKVRSDKNMKGKKRGKNACTAEIIITGVAQLKRYKKKLDKESKEKKATQKSANKSIIN